jgi:radical SAM superfamily enzyme YgiQ (UPF0313 family)
VRVLLILPDGHIHKIRIGAFVRSMREAPLTLTTLAALAPKDSDIDFRLVDESIDTVPLDDQADLVGISVLTGTAHRAYALAKHFRLRGIPVVLGGVHVTVIPEEAAHHADSIVVGPAEKTWPRLLRDLSRGELDKVYKDDGLPNEWLTNIPTPRRDLQRASGYMMSNTVMATRGCQHGCEFCTVPEVWPGYTKRPIGDVIQDIQSMSGRLLTFNDVSLVDDVDYAKELFKAMIPLKRRWGGLATVRVADDPELLDVMARSGCRYLLIGFESISQPALGQIHKGFNREEEYKSLMVALHGYGISVQGTFMFGFDNEDASIFEATVQRVIDLKVDIPRYSVLTPYPGTGLYKRLLAEKRLLSCNWDDYDTMHVVFEPAKMSPDELYRGFKWAYRETFKIPHIVRRTFSLGFAGPISFVGNLTYKRFVRRLYNDERYAKPFSFTSTSETVPATDPAPEEPLWHV